MTPPGQPDEPRPRDRDSDDAAWRDRLLEAVIEGRLSAGDRREIEHRFDTANRPARRHAVRAEIEVLHRFLDIGASIRLEVSRSGRSIDIEATLSDLVFAVHVKRLPSSIGPENTGRVPTILKQALEEVPRPYRVGVDWRDEREPEPSVIDELRGFLLAARMGDGHVIRDERGGIRGFLDVLSPRPPAEGSSEVGTVELVPRGDAVVCDRLVDRAGRLLRRAYRQFAPAMENVIVLAGVEASASDIVDRATLGGHVERWDRLPRVGQRVAHGRDDQGLWSGRHYERSRIVGWAPMNGDPGRVWFREDPSVDPRVVEAVRRAMKVPDREGDRS
jgi:hypothetical protein